MNPAAIFLVIAALSAVPFKPDAPAASSALPPVAEVQKKAVEYARLNPSEISDWKKKARRSALLPKLQIEYDRRVRYDVNVDVNDSVYVGNSGSNVGPESGAYSANQNQDNNISVKAVWSFSEAIFNPDLLAVSEEARLLARERQSILAEVNRNYYEMERLAGEMDVLEKGLRAPLKTSFPGASKNCPDARRPANEQPERTAGVREDCEFAGNEADGRLLGAPLKQNAGNEKIRQEIFAKRIAYNEAAAALDALTGGWFGGEVRKYEGIRQ